MHKHKVTEENRQNVSEIRIQFVNVE